MLKRGRLTDRAQLLRKQMTPQEKRLWYDFLRTRPEGFRRQKVLGAYIVDFYCAKCRLVIELDGSQHYENHAETADRLRTQWLQQQGLTVLRFANSDVDYRFSLVCEEIQRYCLPPEGEGGTAQP